MENINWIERRDFYTRHLKFTMLPFWLSRATDREDGGFYTCFTPDGSQLASTDKYVWSQGRLTWLYSRLSSTSAPIFSDEERENFQTLAKHGVVFLKKHAISPNGECYFLLSKQGEPKESAPESGLITSSFADCFVVLGLSAYAGATKNKTILDDAWRLYHSIKGRLTQNRFRTAPFLVLDGVRIHAIPMMMINMCNELYSACCNLADPRAEDALADGKLYCHQVFQYFVQKDHILLEQVSEDGSARNSFLGRHVNPGHTLEDMWFIMDNCAARDDHSILPEVMQVISSTYKLGSDPKYGGLFYYVDRDGGQPKGACISPQDTEASKQFAHDWDCKLWWPHTEALYTTLRAYFETKDDEFLNQYCALHEYVFRTFPNPDQNTGEWIQLRDRQGNPQSNSIGGRLPVKDPYHANRNLILLIELLYQVTAQEPS